MILLFYSSLKYNAKIRYFKGHDVTTIFFFIIFFFCWDTEELFKGTPKMTILKNSACYYYYLFLVEKQCSHYFTITF